uniref:Uncharacterized protein n=1 Tax=Piliocolobus tephrosceles TaxID=591936 RepID=A0A8C9LJY3_9PRIM
MPERRWDSDWRLLNPEAVGRSQKRPPIAEFCWRCRCRILGCGRRRRPGAGAGPVKKQLDVKKSKFCEADVSNDLRKEVENHYKLPLPEDFFHFWKSYEELDSEKPAGELLQNHSCINGKSNVIGNGMGVVASHSVIPVEAGGLPETKRPGQHSKTSSLQKNKNK